MMTAPFRVCNSESLIICDIDGVLLDSRHRDHLMPVPEKMHHNDHWISHQSAINVAPDPVLALNLHVVRALSKLHPVVLLTSRMELARPGTLRDIEKCKLPTYGLHMRPDDCHLSPDAFKARAVQQILSAPHYPQTRAVIFIDDSRSNIEAVKQAYEAGRYGDIEMHFLQLTPEGYL